MAQFAPNIPLRTHRTTSMADAQRSVLGQTVPTYMLPNKEERGEE